MSSLSAAILAGFRLAGGAFSNAEAASAEGLGPTRTSTPIVTNEVIEGETRSLKAANALSRFGD